MKNPEAEPRGIFVVEEIIIQAEGSYPDASIGV